MELRIMDLRDALKLYREDNSLTQEQIAKELGVRRLTVIRWEQGKCQMNRVDSVKVKKLLRIKVVYCPCCRRKIK